MPPKKARLAGKTAAPIKPRNKEKAPIRYDRRRYIGKRITELVCVLSARLGEDATDPLTAAAILRCAETTALSEHMRAKALRGEDVSTDSVIRTARTADTLMRRLLAKVSPSKQPRSAPKTQPSMGEYLASLSEREAGQ